MTPQRSRNGATAGAAVEQAIRLTAAERALLQSGAVAECVVLARQSSGGATQRIAYVVSRPQTPLLPLRCMR